MIESGSHTPGVAAADFMLPPHTALRYELPDPALAPYVAGYYVFDSEGSSVQNVENHMLPGAPRIDLILADRPIVVTLGQHRYDPMPIAALYGSTSKAMRMISSGGVTVGANITPLGWSRLFRVAADALRDRVVPLQTVMAPHAVFALVGAMRDGLDQGRGAKAVFDAFFAAQQTPATAADHEIRALTALIHDDATRDLAGAAAAIGIDPVRLRRIAKRYFGFPPKTLLLRTRFLRSLLRVMETPDQADYSRISRSYHDASHFLRDANRFLGMTPRRFMQQPIGYLVAVLHARRLVHRAAQNAIRGARIPD